ncbi:MAG: hypothetical protein WCP24_00745 [bacterium]
MSIKDIGEKIKPYWSDKVIPAVSVVKNSLDIKEDIFIVLAVILIGLAGFGLGKLSALEKGREPVQIKSQNQPASVLSITPESSQGLLVASKTGKKYHFPWCAGASQITDKNKIWFNSYEEAQKAGYTPASNCPGLK